MPNLHNLIAALILALLLLLHFPQSTAAETQYDEIQRLRTERDLYWRLFVDQAASNTNLLELLDE